MREQAELVKERHGATLPYEVQHLLWMVEEQHTMAEDAYRYFMLEHPGRSFRVFVPHDIEADFSGDDNEVGVLGV